MHFEFCSRRIVKFSICIVVLKTFEGNSDKDLSDFQAFHLYSQIILKVEIVIVIHLNFMRFISFQFNSSSLENDDDILHQSD
jgi:hypothetical protein